MRVRQSNLPFPPDAIQNDLSDACLLHVSLIPDFKFHTSIIDALVERWRPATHTFWFPNGECTVTLEDVTMLLGLPIDGDAVTGESSFRDAAEVRNLCMEVLGHDLQPDEMTGYFIKDTFLQRRFGWIPPNADRQRIVYHARAYIMRLIGNRLLPGTTSNRVHAKYLNLLRETDFLALNQYSWGSAVLATLYRGLDRASFHLASDISGCMTLLQSWFFYRLPFLAPIPHTIRVFPLAVRYDILTNVQDLC